LPSEPLLQLKIIRVLLNDTPPADSAKAATGARTPIITSNAAAIPERIMVFLLLIEINSLME
jgi:hypothetical protein